MNLKQLKFFLPHVIITLVIFLFVVLAREVIQNETYKLDLSVNNWVFSLRTPFWTSIMKLVSDFGMIGGVFIIGFTCANLVFCKKIDVFYGLLISSVGATLLTYFLKLMIARNRPELTSRLVTESGFSFPSGHSTTAFIAFPILALILWKKNLYIPSLIKYSLITALGVFPFVVAFSRLYLGVHYFTDVVAGAIIGLLATSVFYYFYTKYSNDQKN